MIILSTIPPLYNTVYLIVQEKETRIKESMRMMGMTDVPYWLSWFCWYTFLTTILATLSWLIIIWSVFVHSNKFLVWLVLWIFGLSLFGQIVFLQSFQGKAKYSGVLATVVYLGCSSLCVIVTKYKPVAFQVAMSIFPQVALTRAAHAMTILETSGEGLNFQNIW